MRHPSFYPVTLLCTKCISVMLGLCSLESCLTLKLWVMQRYNHKHDIVQRTLLALMLTLLFHHTLNLFDVKANRKRKPQKSLIYPAPIPVFVWCCCLFWNRYWDSSLNNFWESNLTHICPLSLNYNQPHQWIASASPTNLIMFVSVCVFACIADANLYVCLCV